MASYIHFLSSKKLINLQADWCPITETQANDNPANAYRASKTFAVRQP
jgi:hypothetical protein